MNPANLLTIESLPAKWMDKDEVMLHACFQLLVDCIEKEEIHKYTDWSHTELHRNVKEEMDVLYKWWKERSKMEHIEVDEKQQEADNEKLIRLIKIRKYLWT
ncbi:hypothetical protein AAG747_14725 [Rapidithrix thailandica]|uniref:Uncharacterized protein n=1 Tax=Rapidithrix thailandica TaxID=413964 RepID=A0AAW9S1W9_9BACT